jgi:predicted CxxxxCH...CXXCH cytochrome family protein
VRAHWSGDVDAILQKCLPCHKQGMTEPALDSYFGVSDCKDDGTAWGSPGQSNSPILSVLTRDDHKSILMSSESTELTRWVVDAQLAFSPKFDHAPGFAVPIARGTFHGDWMRKNQFADLIDSSSTWNCMTCHKPGPAPAGAIACASCHGDQFSVQRCGLCHGSGDNPMPVVRKCASSDRQLAVGQHSVHVSAGIQCTACHVVPTALESPGHIPSDPSGRATVVFDPVAGTGATWDPASRMCSNLACHDMRAWAMAPAPAMGACDSCHGNPPPSHKVRKLSCSVCHAPAYDQNGNLRPDKHDNGTLQLLTSCDGCHGGAPNPGFGSDRGAHAIHLSANEFTAAASCSACHVVPAMLQSPGHIDHDLPATVTFSGAPATSNGKDMPAWSEDPKTCANVGCHGANFPGSTVGLPPWSASASAGDIHCGSCHAIPPATLRAGGNHPSTGAESCGDCHTTPAGQPIADIVTGASTKKITQAGLPYHIDGCVEVNGRPQPQGCPP